MKYVSFIIKKSFSKPISMIFVIMQITLALLILNISIGKIYRMQYAGTLITEKDSDNTYYITIRDFSNKAYSNKEQQYALSKAKVEEVKSISGVEYMYSLDEFTILISDNVGKVTTRTVYNYSQTDFNYKPVLQSGKWISDVSCPEGIYPAVISSDLTTYYNIGDIIEGSICDNTFKLQVCGVLKEPNYVMDFSRGGNNLSWSSLFSEHNNIILTQNLPGISGYNRSWGAIIKLADNLLPEEKDRAINELCKHGTLLSFKEINENHKEIMGDEFKKYAINELLLILMAVMGVIGTSVLDSMSELSVYSIWYLCGCRWRNIFILNFLRTLIVLALSMTLTIFILSIEQVRNDLLYDVLISSRNYIVSGGLMLLLLLVANGLVFVVLKKNPPVEIIRRFNKE